MSERELLEISRQLCERGFLRCVAIEDDMPRYELTNRGWLALFRLNAA